MLGHQIVTVPALFCRAEREFALGSLLLCMQPATRFKLK